MRRRRRKAQGEDCSGWDGQQRNWQQGEWDDYGNRQSRFRVLTECNSDDRHGTSKGAVVHKLRPPHGQQVLRREAIGGDLIRSRDGDDGKGKQVRDFSDGEIDQ